METERSHVQIVNSFNVVLRLRELEDEIHRASCHDPEIARLAPGIAFAIERFEQEARSPSDSAKVVRLIEDFLDIPHPLKQLWVDRVLDGDVRDSTLIKCLRVLKVTAYACEVGRRLVLALSMFSPAQRWVLLQNGPEEELRAMHKKRVKWDETWASDYQARIDYPGSWRNHPDWLVKQEQNGEI